MAAVRSVTLKTAARSHHTDIGTYGKRGRNTILGSSIAGKFPVNTHSCSWCSWYEYLLSHETDKPKVVSSSCLLFFTPAYLTSYGWRNAGVFRIHTIDDCTLWNNASVLHELQLNSIGPTLIRFDTETNPWKVLWTKLGIVFGIWSLTIRQVFPSPELSFLNLTLSVSVTETTPNVLVFAVSPLELKFVQLLDRGVSRPAPQPRTHPGDRVRSVYNTHEGVINVLFDRTLQICTP